MDTIGERVKILMEEQGYTEKTLLSALNSSNDPQYPTISKSTLNDILNMDPYAEKHDKGYNYKYFIKLADVFGVSVDYLLCRTNVKPLDNKLQAAADITGLSEKAIQQLKKMSVCNFATWYGDVASSIIESKYFAEIVEYLTELCTYTDFSGSAYGMMYDGSMEDLTKFYPISKADVLDSCSKKDFQLLIQELTERYKNSALKDERAMYLGVMQKYERGEIDESDFQHEMQQAKENWLKHCEKGGD